MINLNNYILEKLHISAENVAKMPQFDKDGKRLVKFLNDCEADMENIKLKHEVKNMNGSKLIWIRCSNAKKVYGPRKASVALTNFKKGLNEYIDKNFSEIRDLVSAWSVSPMQKGYFYVRFSIR